MVADAYLGKPGYVVIHEDADGSPDKIVSHSALLSAGETADVTVMLNTKAGEKYYAMLHTDNGDGTYSAATDLPTKDAAGAIVMQRFSISATETMRVEENKGNTAGATVNVETNGVTSGAAGLHVVVSKVYTVNIQGFSFAQASLTVKKGDKVTFTNKDSVGHTVTADGGAFNSSLLLQGQTYTVDTANLAAGTYTYYCAPHPNMKGTIIVQ